MRIILISSTIEPTSGWGTMSYNHALFLHKYGIDFQLLLPKNSKKTNCDFSDKIDYNLPNLPLTLRDVRDWWKIFYFFKTISLPKYESCTLIHSLTDFPYAVLGWRLAKKFNLPFIFAANGTFSVAPLIRFPDRYLFYPTYKNADRIIAISDFTANKMVDISAHKRPIDIISIPVTKTTGLPDLIPDNKLVNARIILSVGPLKLRKGLDVLIKALARVVKEEPRAHLVMVGKGDQKKYRELARLNNIENRISIYGSLTSIELAGLFSQCDVFALTPRYINHEFEGYGLVYLEAGLYKKPVVASCSGGVPEAVIDGQTGILVPENDVEATAKAILKILQDKKLACQLGENNFKLAQERNWDDYIKKIINIYQNVLSPKSSIH